MFHWASFEKVSSLADQYRCAGDKFPNLQIADHIWSREDNAPTLQNKFFEHSNTDAVFRDSLRVRYAESRYHTLRYC